MHRGFLTSRKFILSHTSQKINLIHRKIILLDNFVTLPHDKTHSTDSRMGFFPFIFKEFSNLLPNILLSIIFLGRQFFLDKNRFSIVSREKSVLLFRPFKRLGERVIIMGIVGNCVFSSRIYDAARE